MILTNEVYNEEMNAKILKILKGRGAVFNMYFTQRFMELCKKEGVAAIFTPIEGITKDEAEKKAFMIPEKLVVDLEG